ncbi:FtsX-like permease family protein [Rhodococcus fascians]|nr:FtsX-like permease family protein [Rhodococcus fascians]
MTFLVAAFLIYTATAMALTARRPRISMLRALGGARGTIVGDLLLETAIVSCIGALIGSVPGAFVARITIDQLPSLFLQSLSTRIEFAFPLWIVPTAVIVATSVCLIAACLAARQVYRVSPVEALAPVRALPRNRIRSKSRVAAAVIAPVFGAVAFYNATRQPGILANSGITIMFAAEIALGVALSGVIVGAAARVARLFAGPGILASETIRRTPTRSWATLMTVAVAVAATLAISAGNSNVVDSTKESFTALRDADVWVSSTPAGQFPTGPPLQSGVLDAVSAVSGVSDVNGEYARYVSVGDQRALVYGVTDGGANPLVAAADARQRAETLVGNGVVVSRDLAESLTVGVGDEVSLSTGTGPHRVRVVAVVPFFSALNGAMAMSQTQMATLFGAADASALAVRVIHTADVDQVLRDIENILPAGIYAYTGDAGIDAFGAALDQATTLNHLIWIIVTIIAGVALLNTLLMSVMERSRELAVLRAIGSSRRFVVGMVGAEALAVGIVGGLLGLAFGVMQQVVANLASSRAWSVDVHFEMVPVSLALAAGALLLCVSGSLPPAIRVSKLNMIKTMRVE